jgi:F-type H+-transporting ATPase subunit epsilon
MADSTFHLVIASVGESRFDGPAVSATIPTAGGEITVLPHHSALVSTLKTGEIRVKDASGTSHAFPIESGVLEVSGNRVVVLL